MRQIAARKATRKAIYKPLVDLPPLSPEDYAGLRASIAVSGVVVPIIVWPHRGVHYVVDGSYRRTIARGLGYECPEIVRSDLTEEEARIMARALNLARRQLSTAEKRQIIADQLQETPERSARWVGKMLGVDHKTVLSVRAELQSGGEIPHLTTTLGRDGKSYPTSILTSGPTSAYESATVCVNHERYTPSWLVESVRQVFGKIDLDPASSKQANKVVKANVFFTKKMDGLKRRWRGRVFLNPPFDNWPAWVAKLDREIEAHRVKQVIVVGPANLSAYRCLLKRDGLLLVPSTRPKYYDPGGDKLVDPPFGSLICYVGGRRDSFLAAFRAHGLILRAVS